MDRYSLTGRVFQRRATSDGTVTVPPSGSDDPGFLRRLAWRAIPRARTKWAELIDAIRGEAQIDAFCDNSIFADDTPSGLWDVLLGAPGRLVITPRVWQELLPWLKRRPDHRLAAAIRDGDPGIRVCNEPGAGQPGRRVFDYYMALLKILRNGAPIARGAFRRQYGRDPDPGEERDGMLLAEHYSASTGAFCTTPIPARILEDPEGPFEPGGVLVERDAYMRNVLPGAPGFVAISCWNTGTYTSGLAFGAETQMNRLLETKDITGGLSTSLLGGRNMHASVSPLPVGGRPTGLRSFATAASWSRPAARRLRNSTSCMPS